MENMGSVLLDQKPSLLWRDITHTQMAKQLALTFPSDAFFLGGGGCNGTQTTDSFATDSSFMDRTYISYHISSRYPLLTASGEHVHSWSQVAEIFKGLPGGPRTECFSPALLVMDL